MILRTLIPWGLVCRDVQYGKSDRARYVTDLHNESWLIRLSFPSYFLVIFQRSMEETFARRITSR